MERIAKGAPIVYTTRVHARPSPRETSSLRRLPSNQRTTEYQRAKATGLNAAAITKYQRQRISVYDL